MSYKNYSKAVKKAKKCDGYSSGDKHSLMVVNKAEQLLGIKFSKQVSEYLSKYGYIEFFGVELYGIINEDFAIDDDSNEGCMVEWTLKERQETSLNPKWVALKFEDDGEMVFLDFSDLNEEGEPKVIVAVATEDGYELEEILAEDFGDYLLDLVEIQLEEQ